MTSNISETVLATWEVTVSTDDTSIIIPDGCQDLIMLSLAGSKPSWFVSPLFDKTHTVTLASGSTMLGFRIRPGTRINEKKLLGSMSEYSYELDAINERLDTFTTYKKPVEEALHFLASDVRTVTQVAKKIGITPRTLQRLVMRETGKTPVYWMMLARARKAARGLHSTIRLSELADFHSYADQAHMCREFKRWFNISPSLLRNSPNMLIQFYHKGYAGVDTGVHNSIKKPSLSDT